MIAEQPPTEQRPLSSEAQIRTWHMTLITPYHCTLDYISSWSLLFKPPDNDQTSPFNCLQEHACSTAGDQIVPSRTCIEQLSVFAVRLCEFKGTGNT